MFAMCCRALRINRLLCAWDLPGRQIRGFKAILGFRKRFEPAIASQWMESQLQIPTKASLNDPFAPMVERSKVTKRGVPNGPGA